MITNERQYRISKAWVNKFEVALESAKARATAKEPTHPKLLKARQDQLTSQLEELREDLAEYEALKSGNIHTLEVADLQDLPTALIRARIAAGLSQQKLAEKLGVTAQQVQKDEASQYHKASFDRMAKVAEILGIKLKGQVVLG